MEPPSLVCQSLDPGQKTINASRRHAGETLGKERNNKGNAAAAPAMSAPKHWVCATCGKLNLVGIRGSCNVCTVCGRSKEGVKLGAASRVTAIDMQRAGLQESKKKGSSKSCTRGGVIDLLDNAETKPLSNWKTFQRTRRKTEKAATDHMSLSAEINKLIRQVRS